MKLKIFEISFRLYFSDNESSIKIKSTSMRGARCKFRREWNSNYKILNIEEVQNGKD